MKVEVIHRKMTKPSSSTSPHHLTTYHLILIHQFTQVTYVPLILFCPHFGSNGDLDHHSITKKTQHLRKTLSKSLTYFYALARRIKASDSIKCNVDEGVEFVEANINSTMSKILEQPNTQLITQFLATEPESKAANNKSCLLQLRVTFFQCCGMAIGLSFFV